jgi:uncharacterized membrane protein
VCTDKTESGEEEEETRTNIPPAAAAAALGFVVVSARKKKKTESSSHSRPSHTHFLFFQNEFFKMGSSQKLRESRQESFSFLTLIFLFFLFFFSSLFDRLRKNGKDFSVRGG